MYSTFPSHSIHIFKLRLITFIKVNDGDDPAYSVKTQSPGVKRLGGETSINLLLLEDRYKWAMGKMRKCGMRKVKCGIKNAERR